MSNTTSRPPVSSLNMGGSLFEIAALTALIGSTTAESLVLGNKGAAGLLWGTMSIFGALSKEIDGAIGVSLNLDKTTARNIRRGSSAIGVACKVRMNSEDSDSDSKEISRHDTYAFDQCTSGILELLPTIEATGSFESYVLIQDVYSRESNMRIAWIDWISIIISFVKILELFVMWKHQAIELVIISACCWGFHLIVSSILQLLGLSREYSVGVKGREMDVVAGQLPNPIRGGGQRKILLGAPQNVRDSLVWKFSWGLASVVSIVAVIATYMNLGKQHSRVFGVWTGFQFAWLALRSVFFHFAEGTDRVYHHPILVKRDWKTLSNGSRTRVKRVVCAISKYQMHVHPRGIYCYEEDLQTLDQVYDMRKAYPVTSVEICSSKVEITVTAIIGDTLLSSVCWMFGSKLTGMDLYDSCVVIVKIGDRSLAIPAARVLTDRAAAPKPDPEAGIGPMFPLRGNSNTGRDIYWMYWIPCHDGGWLQLQTTDMKFLGNRTADKRSDAQVTQKLASGDLLVSLSEIQHVKEIVSLSQTGFEVLQNMLRGCKE